LKTSFIIAFCLLAQLVLAQKITVVSNGTLPKIKYKKQYNNEQELASVKQSIVSQLRSKGYVTASIDSTVKNKESVTVYVYVGESILWSYLNTKYVPDEVLRQSGFKQKWYNGKPLNPQQFSTLCNKIVRYYENHGFPFAEVFLDSIAIEDSKLKANLKVLPHKKIMLDSIIVKSNDNISTHLVQNIIQLKRGEIYNESKIKQISNKLKESGLFIENEPWKILFTQTETKLYLFLSNNKSSQFNGIAGIQPDPITNRITITGDVDLRLQNVLKRAETMNVKWRKFQQLSQELKIQANYPYILQSQFGADLQLHLYKRDTTFLELNQKVEAQYFLNSGSTLKGFAKRYSSQTQSAYLDSSFSTVNIIYYGLGVLSNRLDYRLNPLKGYYFDINGGIGSKNISSQNDDSEQDKVPQGILEGVVEFYFPIAKKATIKLGNQSKYLISRELYSNELFRIGGLRTMRGFDEESLFASLYSISTLEIRYLLERNSNIYLFSDFAYFESITKEISRYNNATSFGLGVNFETGAGIFSINYGLGRLSENSFELRAAKIHFGFAAIF
jgi:outer membrane protein assembly factor BamA